MNVSPLEKEVLILCNKEPKQNANIIKTSLKAFSSSMLVYSLVLGESMSSFVRNRNVSIVEYTSGPGHAGSITTSCFWKTCKSS